MSSVGPRVVLFVGAPVVPTEVSLAGNQPAATGTLAKTTLRALSGVQPAATGTLTRLQLLQRSVAGNQPAATGTLTRVQFLKRSLAGAQPAASGSLAKKTLKAVGQTTVDLIMLNTQPAEAPDYFSMNAWPSTRVSLREWRWDKDGAEIQALDAAGTPYFWTAAASDFIVQAHPLYETTAHVAEVLARPACQGIYFHELATYLASINGYNWTVGVEAIDWSWVDAVVALAEAAGKRVIWSEPAQGWPTMLVNATAAAHLSTYDPDLLVPTYATNFAPRTLVDDAEDGAQATAALYSTALGMSHQIWWWLDSAATVTRAESQALMERGIAAGATVIAVEGPDPYMTWGDDYVGGVEDWATAYTAGGEIAGLQPAPSGTLAAQQHLFRSLAGNQPAATGTIAAAAAGTPNVLLAGNQPAATGTLTALVLTAAAVDPVIPGGARVRGQRTNQASTLIRVQLQARVSVAGELVRAVPEKPRPPRMAEPKARVPVTTVSSAVEIALAFEVALDGVLEFTEDEAIASLLLKEWATAL